MSTNSTLQPLNGAARGGAMVPEEGAARPGMARLLAFARRRPVVAATALVLADLVVVAAAGLAGKLVLPAESQWPDFLAMCAGILFLVAGLTALGWWRAVGFNRPAHWRKMALLALPAAIFALLPFARGARSLDAGTAAFYVVGYALTGFYEEGFFRGIVMRVLRPLGVTRTVFICAALFGAAHLVNLLFRNPFIVLAQAVGAFTDGVGLAALRLRTRTLWGVIVLHACHDLFLQYTRLPKIPLDVVQDTIMFFYGLYLLRGLRAVEWTQAGASQTD